MVTNNRPTIKDRIEKEFGSINKFVDANYTKLGISRTYLYSLLNKNEECNPTINILVRLSVLTKIPVEEIFNEYSMRYRKKQIAEYYSAQLTNIQRGNAREPLNPCWEIREH